MPRCPQCNEPVPKKATTCPSCGASLEDDVQNEATPDAGEAAVPPPPPSEGESVVAPPPLPNQESEESPTHPPVTEVISPDARTWGMLAHLAAFAGFIFPFGNILGPLVVYLIKKDEYPFVEDQGKESLNFQITVSILALICIPLLFICVGFPLLIIIGLAAIVFQIIAAVKANKGEYYRYPWALRLIK